jgi:hypothetical protein
MNKYSKIIALLLAAGACTAAKAGLFSDNFETTVVAEHGKDAPAAQDGAVIGTLVDGGYIEAGDPIAGDEPPSAASVRQELIDALGQKGFQIGASPSVVLAYYWGVLRIDHHAVRLPYGINANQDARIKLVSTEETGAEVENHILGEKQGGGQDLDASSPAILVGPLDTILQNARKARYFVVVSAYQNNDAGDHQKPKLLWRVKLSAQETSGSMDEVIPALIAKGASYFGKDIQDPKIVQNTLMKSVTPSSSSQSSSNQNAMADNGSSSPAVNALIKQERVQISGLGDGKS